MTQIKLNGVDLSAQIAQVARARDAAETARDIASRIALGDAAAALAGGILDDGSVVHQAVASEVGSDSPIGAAIENKTAADMSYDASVLAEATDHRIGQRVATAVADAVAADPTVVAAAAAAVSDLDVVLRTDPGAPSESTQTVEEEPYAEVVTDLDGRLTEGTRTDGTKHVPKLFVDALSDARSTTSDGPDVEVNGQDATFIETDSDGRVSYAEGTDGSRYIARLRVGTLNAEQVGGAASYWSDKLIAAYGTSITAAFVAGVGDVPTEGFMYKAIVGDLGATLDNQGVDSSGIVWDGVRALSLGATQAQLTTAGFDPAQSYEAKVLGKDADLYIFDHGYNDRDRPLGTIADATAATFYGAYNVVLDALIADKPDAQIMLITPPSLWSPVGEGFNTGTAAVREAILEIGEKYAAPVLDLAARLNFNEDQAGTFLPDTVHPSAAAFDRMARQLAAFIRGL